MRLRWRPPWRWPGRSPSRSRRSSRLPTGSRAATRRLRSGAAPTGAGRRRRHRTRRPGARSPRSRRLGGGVQLGPPPDLHRPRPALRARVPV